MMRRISFFLTGFVLIVMLCTGIVIGCEYPAQVQVSQPPANLSVAIQVDQVGSTINATFRGGAGQFLIQGIQVQVIQPDCSNETKSLGTNVGDTVSFVGSGCGDQVIGTVTFMTGDVYTIVNQTLAGLPGICSAYNKPTPDTCAEIVKSPSLQPVAVDEVPDNKSISIQVSTDMSNIDVSFRGGLGQNMAKSIVITRVGPDGSVDSRDLPANVGASLRFTATNSCSDRIYGDLFCIDGTSYHFYDKIIRIYNVH